MTACEAGRRRPRQGNRYGTSCIGERWDRGEGGGQSAWRGEGHAPGRMSRGIGSGAREMQLCWEPWQRRDLRAMPGGWASGPVADARVNRSETAAKRDKAVNTQVWCTRLTARGARKKGRRGS
jgi:hypothetical protein